MTYLSPLLRGMAALCLPLTLSAQFSTLHSIGQSTGHKNSLAFSDIDGDTRTDLVVGSEKYIYWIPNAGAGEGLAAPRIITEASGVAAVGDIDQDGDADVACTRAYYIDQTYYTDLAWFRNDGQGNFTLASAWSQGYSTSIYLADMDTDGDLDVVAMNGRIVWYKNLDGTGTLSGELLVVNLFNQRWMKPLDLDSDGDLDVVYHYAGRAKWRENTNGLGTAWGPEQELVDREPKAGDTADIDGDGLKDLVLTVHGQGLVWFKRTPTGFGTYQQFLFSAVSDQLLCIGDLDTDGDADVIGSSPGKLTLYQNNGSGTFLPKGLGTPEAVADMGFADMDNDGVADLVVANREPEKILWYPKTGAAAYGAPRYAAAEFVAIGGLAVADLDGDNDLDVVAANNSLQQGSKPLVWYENQGGYFPRHHIVASDWADFSRVRAADLDGDKDPDLLCISASPYRICWFENDGAGRFDSVHTLASSPSGGGIVGGAGVVAVDVDNDGDLDVAVCQSYSDESIWFRNLDGKGSFAPSVVLSAGDGPEDIAVADVTGDHIPDLFQSGTSAFGHYLSLNTADSAGYFDDWGWNLNVSHTPKDMEAGDLDGDGIADMVALGQEGMVISSSKFTLSKKIVSDGPPHYGGLAVAVTDVDLDGDNDLVVTSESNDRSIRWFENADGLGNFNPPSLVLSDVSNQSYLPNMVCGDMDGDKDPDIVFVNEGLRQIFWLENEVAGSRVVSGRCFWDVNGNGQPDNGEVGLEQLPVHLSPLPRTVYSNGDGAFRMYVPPGQFDVTFEPHVCQKLTTPATLPANTLNGPVDSLFFGVQYNPDSSGLRAWMTSWTTRCHAQVSFKLVLENTGCVAESGTVALSLSDLAKYDVAYPVPKTISSTELIWDFQDIPPGNRHAIDLIFIIAGASHIGDSIIMLVQPHTTTGGVQTERKPFRYTSVVNCAFDPNDKQVWPARGDDNPVYDGEELAYTIRFQNTGTDTAFSVVVRDRLSPALDWSTLRPLAASHPFTTTLDESGLLEFRFENILLPDSNINYAGSQGYVTFLVRLRENLALDTRIDNAADIYFDFNPPVVTNTVSVHRLDPTSSVVVPQTNIGVIRLFPNPFSEGLYFQWNNAGDAASSRLELWDATRRLAASVRLPEGSTGAVQTPDLPGGFYGYKIVRERDGRVLGSGKLIKF